MEKIVPRIGGVIDQIHVSQLSALERSRKHLLKVLLGSSSTTAERVRSMCNIAGVTVPGFEKKLAGILSDPSVLGDGSFEPFCIGYGDEQTVFRVAENTVRKVDRHSLGGSVVDLTKRVESLGSTHLTLKGLFVYDPGIVVDETFDFGPSHIRFFNAVRATQQYFHKPKDFYNDVTIEEGQHMVKEDAVFGGQIEYFQSQFLRYLEVLGVCPDILGSKNLIVTEGDEGYRLKLLDAHMMHDVNQWSDEQAASKQRRLGKRIDHLRRMLG